jgi:double zinc ribbon protein
MPPPALLGIENDALNLVVNLLLLVLAALWLALVFWTYKDAVRRIADPWLVVTGTLVSFIFPFIGTVVYLILRPPEYLEDVRERELEIAAAEARLMQLQQVGCPQCGTAVERSFLRCPSCLTRLREPCATCGKPLDPSWRLCPYCEADIGQAAQPQRRRRRVSAAGAERGRAPATSRAGSQPAGDLGRPATDRAAARQTAPESAAPGRTTVDGAPAEDPTVTRPRPSTP